MFDKADIRPRLTRCAEQDQATRFEAFLKTRTDPDRMLDPENLRFLANFNDVFLAIGMAVLVAGIPLSVGEIFGNMIGMSKFAITMTALPVLVALGRWQNISAGDGDCCCPRWCSRL